MPCTFERSAGTVSAPPRVRGALDALPFLPSMCELGRTGPWPRAAREAEQEAHLGTNRSVAELRALWDGNFAKLQIVRREGPWHRNMVARILDAHRRRRQLERAPHGEEAIRRLMSLPLVPYADGGDTLMPRARPRDQPSTWRQTSCGIQGAFRRC